MTRVCTSRILQAALLTVLAMGGAAQAATVPPALQELRRHMLDADVNALTFHEMDQFFDVSRVDNAGPVWELPSAVAPLSFSYEFQGKTYAAGDFLQRTDTNALIILKGGRIVSETYLNHTDEHTHFISFSMAKSITSMLIGLAVQDGSIHSLDDQVTRYVPELSHCAYDGATIRDVLGMRSGANYQERYDFANPGLASADFEESLVQNRYRFASFARVMTRAYPPGQHFNYSTIDTAVLGWVLERATHRSITDYMTEKLWKRLGAQSYGFWLLDGPPGVGREFNGAGFNAVGRDYARLGLMMLQQGMAHGRQVLPRQWVADSTAPRQAQAVAPGSELGYRYQWWTLVGTDAYMALGLQGQFIYVDPPTQTVIVKLSYFPPGDDHALTAETLAFFRAASRWTPN